MRAKGLLSVVMTGALMASALSGCGFKPDITWTDTANGDKDTYKVTVVVAHDGTLSIDREQNVKDGGTLNFIATPAEGNHQITGLMVDGVVQKYTGTLPDEGEVRISLENINQDMTVVVLCDNLTGGLGGVDGAVTGLDGTGGGAGGGVGSSDGGSGDDGSGDGDKEPTEDETNGASTYDLTVDAGEHGTLNIAYTDNDASMTEEIGDANEGEEEKTDIDVDSDTNMTLAIDADYGWQVASILANGNPLTFNEEDPDDVVISIDVDQQLADNEQIEIVYVPETYNVSATCESIAGHSSATVSSKTAKYQESSVSVDVTVDKGYTPKVTAVVTNVDTKEETRHELSGTWNDDTYTFTLDAKYVTGNVDFDVNFEKDQVTVTNINIISGSVTYINGHYSVANLQVEFTKSDTTEETRYLSGEVEGLTFAPDPDKLQPGNNEISVTYTVGDVTSEPYTTNVFVPAENAQIVGEEKTPLEIGTQVDYLELDNVLSNAEVTYTVAGRDESFELDDNDVTITVTDEGGDLVTKITSDGTYTITVTYKGGELPKGTNVGSYSYDVTVVAPAPVITSATITGTPTNQTLFAGDTQTKRDLLYGLTMVPVYDNGTQATSESVPLNVGNADVRVTKNSDGSTLQYNMMKGYKFEDPGTYTVTVTYTGDALPDGVNKPSTSWDVVVKHTSATAEKAFNDKGDITPNVDVLEWPNDRELINDLRSNAKEDSDILNYHFDYATWYMSAPIDINSTTQSVENQILSFYTTQVAQAVSENSSYKWIPYNVSVYIYVGEDGTGTMWVVYNSRWMG